MSSVLSVTDQTASPLGSTEVTDLRSEAVGDTFRIFTAQCGARPQTVLLVTDANGLFGLTVDTVRLMQLPALVPPTLIVGIGYPDAATLADTVQIRARDLTPTHTSLYQQSGGADNFISFIDTELRPWVAERFPDTAGDFTYFGHSLGGLFGTYVLLTKTDLFARYILSSPSLWWDGEVAFRLEQELAETVAETAGVLRAEAFFGIGGLETDAGRRAEAINLADDHPAKPPDINLDMVDDLRRFETQLRSRPYPDLRLKTVVMPDEFHTTVPGVILARALRHFHSPASET